ncbi:hypothetical protein PV433_25900 [Paenibacillus sp. GYB004]|uniref:hypothetical protein n=1 Tax=Paenibacillus sp. GYB004 TaxID=2994393 RepID=UPI002F9639A0
MRKPIQYEMPKYVELPGVLPPIINREWRGVNTFDPMSIGDNFFTDMSNFTTADYPAVSVRPGYSVIGNAGAKVLGLGVWKDTELHAVFDDGTWRKWDGASWVTLKSGLDPSAMWSFTSFEGNFGGINLIGANGVNGLHRYDGSTVQTFGDAPSNIDYVTTYQNRIWGAFGSEIRACKLDDATSWNSFPGTEEDSYGKQMESTRGENINMLSGGLTKLTIGMPNSLHELYGGTPSEFTLMRITEDYGVMNNQSVSTLAGSMRLIHPTGLYEWQGGTIPSKSFSDIVGGYQHNISGQTASGADGTMQYFALSDKILEYDARPNITAWNVWKGMQPSCFVLFKNELYMGDHSGRVIKLGGQDDAGVPISGYLISKPFTSPSIAQRQRWLNMYAVWELAAGSTLTVSLSSTVGGNDWEAVESITGTGLSMERIIIPVRKFVLENTVRVRFDIVGWGRMHEFTRQVRLLPLR